MCGQLGSHALDVAVGTPSGDFAAISLFYILVIIIIPLEEEDRLVCVVAI